MWEEHRFSMQTALAYYIGHGKLWQRSLDALQTASLRQLKLGKGGCNFHTNMKLTWQLPHMKRTILFALARVGMLISGFFVAPWPWQDLSSPQPRSCEARPKPTLNAHCASMPQPSALSPLLAAQVPLPPGHPALVPGTMGLEVAPDSLFRSPELVLGLHFDDHLLLLHLLVHTHPALRPGRGKLRDDLDPLGQRVLGGVQALEHQLDGALRRLMAPLIATQP